jgi:hypothetical protein
MTKQPPAPGTVRARTSDTPPPALSFNEVYLHELQALRPGVFPGDGADAVPAEPLAPVGAPELDRQANESARARNLVRIFRAVHDRLADGGAPEQAPLAAVCLSGGGIRSATFNLGVIQGLVRLGLLGRFDYLSSVSGGGYIAGWLKAWTYRDGTDAVVRELASVDPAPASAAGQAPAPVGAVPNCASPFAGPAPRDPLAPEPKPLDRLREYSNYLTPKVGIFSPDTWTAAALIVRNLLLNWLVLVPLLGAVVAVPQAAVLAVQTRPSAAVVRWIVALAVASAFLASVFVHWLRQPRLRGNQAGQRLIVFGVVFPIYLAAALLSLGVAWLPWRWWPARAGLVGFVALWTVLVPTVGWLLVEAWQAVVRRLVVGRGGTAPRHRGRGFWWELAALIVSGALAGALLLWVAYHTVCGAACGEAPYLLERPILYVIIALPTLLADYLIARTLFVAIAGLGEEGRHESPPPDDRSRALLDDFDREWWARLSGWVLAFALGWLVFSAVTLIAGYLLHRYAGDYAREAAAAMGGAAGIATALLAKGGGTASGRGTNTVSTSRRSDISLRSVAPVFIVALLALLAYGTAALGRKLTGRPDLLRYPRVEQAATRRAPLLDRLRVGEPADYHGTRVSAAAFWDFVVRVPLLLVGAALLASRVVNVNRFSMHGLYRNRLVRAYLGASNVWRRPDPFTGFATTDNVLLHQLWRAAPDREHQGTSTRPLPVINTTLNLVTGSKRLAWQLRKAESFSMSPFHCGNFHEGYRPSSRYGGRDGITLGTAMTISGAAANPNMGYNSSPAITFLMSLLNARLGAWLGNTNEYGRRVYQRSGPQSALRPLVAELFGQTDAEHPYVNLSDGGHFDNLGLYEMVLRRCRYILVCDAGRDPSAGFEDLGNVIRKVRIDFGIPIDFGERIRIFPREEREGGLFCATARIRYSEIDGPGVADGRLVYVKPALFGHGEPIPYDVLAYARRSEEFPHESTSDQWFDEAQFESYRALGRHTLDQISRHAGRPADFPAFLRSVESYIETAAARPTAATTTTTTTTTTTAPATAPAPAARPMA